ncbi:FMN-binding protein MioC [Thalassotalea fusca]
MANIQIIVGSMLGGTEYVAEACEETLTELGHQVTTHLTPTFNEIPLKDQIWLICTSTHGAGDYPDNIQPFLIALEKDDRDLSPLNFFVIGTGDSNYDTFCLAAKNIRNTLISKGCTEISPLFTIDMQQDIDPEAVAQEWILSKKDQLHPKS